MKVFVVIVWTIIYIVTNDLAGQQISNNPSPIILPIVQLEAMQYSLDQSDNKILIKDDTVIFQLVYDGKAYRFNYQTTEAMLTGSIDTSGIVYDLSIEACGKKFNYNFYVEYDRNLKKTELKEIYQLQEIDSGTPIMISKNQKQEYLNKARESIGEFIELL